MLSPEQIAANRKSAANLIKTQLGLSEKPSEWTYEQRGQYNKTLAQYIKDHPSAFGETELATADLVAQKTYSPMEDPGFAFSTFIEEVGANASAPLVAIGNGVINTAKLAGFIMPALLIIGAVILIYAANAKAGSPIKLPSAK